MERIHGHLSKLLPYCEGLPLTTKKINSVLHLVENPQMTAGWKEPRLAFLTAIAEIRSRLDDELSTLLFFRLPAERAHYFDNYREGWEEVVARFPETISDIEEMSKCFALSRYTAAVFHSLLTVEWGVIHLGTFIGVTDPKRGWDATCKKLSAIMSGGHSNAPAALAPHFGFLEQTNQCVQTMKHAWRNKVNHSDGKLAVLGSDFTPDIAEEIIMAARSFMRRLATEMP